MHLNTKSIPFMRVSTACAGGAVAIAGPPRIGHSCSADGRIHPWRATHSPAHIWSRIRCTYVFCRQVGMEECLSSS